MQKIGERACCFILRFSLVELFLPNCPFPIPLQLSCSGTFFSYTEMLLRCNSESSKKQPQPHICFFELLSVVCPSAITRRSSTTTTPSNGKSPTIKAQSTTESTRHETTDGHRQPQPPPMAIVDHRDHHHHDDFHGTYTRRAPSSQHSPQPTAHSPHRPADHLPPTTATTARITHHHRQVPPKASAAGATSTSATATCHDHHHRRPVRPQRARARARARAHHLRPACTQLRAPWLRGRRGQGTGVVSPSGTFFVASVGN